MDLAEANREKPIRPKRKEEEEKKRRTHCPVHLPYSSSDCLFSKFNNKEGVLKTAVVSLCLKRMLWDQKHQIIIAARDAGGLTLSRGRLEVEEVESHVGLDDLVLVVKGGAAEGHQLSAGGLH